MKIKHLISALTAVMMLFTFTSCNEDDGTSGLVWTNLVTYDGIQNGYSKIIYQEINDAAPLTLLVKADMSSQSIMIGDRLFISFTAETTQLTNNTIVTPIEYYPIITVEPEFTNEIPPANWEESNELYIGSFFRSGNFINMASIVPSTSQKIELKFFVDNSSVQTGDVVAYFTYENAADQPGAVLNTNLFNSIDISSIWSNPNVKSLTVYFHNANQALNQGNSAAGTAGNDRQSWIFKKS